MTSEEFAAISDGSAVLSNGQARGKGMFCVTGSNELNAVALTMSHVNGYFLPENVGNMDWGFENGYDYALSLVEKHGGVSHINHPDTSSSMKYIKQLLELRYPLILRARYNRQGVG